MVLLNLPFCISSIALFYPIVLYINKEIFFLSIVFIYYFYRLKY